MTGADPENLTMRLGVRQVLDAGQRYVEIAGPFDLPEATAVHEGFWDPAR